MFREAKQLEHFSKRNDWQNQKTVKQKIETKNNVKVAKDGKVWELELMKRPELKKKQNPRKRQVKIICFTIKFIN